MKLDSEGQSYAASLFRQQENAINVERSNRLRRILAAATPEDPRLIDITDLLYKLQVKLLLMKVESYVTAHRTYGLTLDYEDQKKIQDELRNLNGYYLNFVLSLEGVREHSMPSHHAIRNVPEFVMYRFDNALEQATERLRAGMFEVNLEVKRQQVTSASTVNVGTNYGNIQQGGSGNTQSTNRNDDEAK
jgi:hypothetical protein